MDNAGEHGDVTSLVLRRMAHPSKPERSILVFRDAKRAVQHLRDHVLTAPECEGWAVILDGVMDRVDLGNDDARWRSARAITDQVQEAQALYDLYSGMIESQFTEAGQLHWFYEQSTLAVGIGTLGVLVVSEGAGGAPDAVKTAFLPGQGVPIAVVRAREDSRPTGALARESRAMRAGRRDRLHGDSEREARECERRMEGMTRDERIYYQVFRPAIQFVRRQYHRHRDVSGRPMGNDYAHLKSVLPPVSQLKYEAWQALRVQLQNQNPEA